MHNAYVCNKLDLKGDCSGVKKLRKRQIRDNV